MTSVFVLGYPLTDLLGNDMKITNGIINSLTGLHDDSNLIQISAQAQPGNSGSPVIDSDFKVIGVVNSKLSDVYMLLNAGSIAQNVNFAINSDLVSLYGREYITEGKNYVSNIREARDATVKIEAGGTELSSEKQYKIEFSYTYYFNYDLGYWSVSSLRIYCCDIETGDVVADASFSGYIVRQAKTIARQTAKELLEGLGLKAITEDEE